MMKNTPLLIAGWLSMAAAVAHLLCIVGGPDWYRFFGAGERMAQMAADGDIYPTMITAGIALLLSIWGLYAFSGAGIIRRLPLCKTCLVLISVIFCARGLAGFFVPFLAQDSMMPQNSPTFWLVSSLICCAYGLLYWQGTRRLFKS
ncbi:hypothetical protein [Alteromonas lipolytica]|uniref:DUF3995 domain-containing protein n=1 Tax=Alteromonas lipolytica TaxID=1856405 RepID=A0A1E8FJG3_9ALTE|nr:hypothetical protein [Alteromonas lipolytica]OFI36077.1 hypothetical protein BFC17_10450 [Alteromonas lipolytica]